MELYRDNFEKTKDNRKRLIEAMPEVMNGLFDITTFARSEGALDLKTKELISLAMSIIIKCDECVTHHTISLYELGCTREELIECLGLTIVLQSCPGLKYSQLALDCFDQLVEKEGSIE